MRQKPETLEQMIHELDEIVKLIEAMDMDRAGVGIDTIRRWRRILMACSNTTDSES